VDTVEKIRRVYDQVRKGQSEQGYAIAPEWDDLPFAIRDAVIDAYIAGMRDAREPLGPDSGKVIRITGIAEPI
jgi:hypothetical protein